MSRSLDEGLNNFITIILTMNKFDSALLSNTQIFHCLCKLIRSLIYIYNSATRERQLSVHSELFLSCSEIFSPLFIDFLTLVLEVSANKPIVNTDRCHNRQCNDCFQGNKTHQSINSEQRLNTIEEIRIDFGNIITEEAQNSTNRCYIVVNIYWCSHNSIKDILEEIGSRAQANSAVEIAICSFNGNLQ